MSEPDLVTSPESATSPAISAMGARGAHEFIRYFVASGIALCLDVGSLYVLTSIFTVPYLISAVIAFVIGLTTIYVLSVNWVFEHRVLRDAKAEFAVFTLIGMVGLALNELVLWVLTGQLGLYYLLAKGVSIAVVFSWNFGARKWLLFR